MPVVAVPGAAATLVSSASVDPLVTGVPGIDPPAAAEPATQESPSTAVGLVFADGASVELAADDPRVRTFRAAAAAVLDQRAR
jgi:hypothetical protein